MRIFSSKRLFFLLPNLFFILNQLMKDDFMLSLYI